MVIITTFRKQITRGLVRAGRVPSLLCLCLCLCLCVSLITRTTCKPPPPPALAPLRICRYIQLQRRPGSRSRKPVRKQNCIVFVDGSAGGTCFRIALIAAVGSEQRCSSEASSFCA
ncbi:hypothetical protein K431DRAFT_91377 [Polychaeton citri CBS 116435]|uniref:Uncharacterized protein n=1 Tax=Polychaeton citri CBS 116435 TaxID=1314669 RepID=A0A9P4ULS3_9PEZI|nr:hypothetical protein K431DRAFT_91377 [Polychaeton citri CBS 116435]